MAELIIVSDSITFAKEIAQDVELSALADGRLSTEGEIQAAVDIMNHHLLGMEQDERVILQAAEAFTIPTDIIDAEFMTEAEIEAARVNDVLIRARLRSFVWFGSVGLRGFGADLYGVDFIDPKIHHTETAFVPLDAAGARIKQLKRY
jgi:hypothetical protein